MSGEYQQQYQQFQRDPGQFWLEQSKRIAWFKASAHRIKTMKTIFIIGLPMARLIPVI